MILERLNLKESIDNNEIDKLIDYLESGLVYDWDIDESMDIQFPEANGRIVIDNDKTLAKIYKLLNIKTIGETVDFSWADYHIIKLISLNNGEATIELVDENGNSNKYWCDSYDVDFYRRHRSSSWYIVNGAQFWVTYTDNSTEEIAYTRFDKSNIHNDFDEGVGADQLFDMCVGRDNEESIAEFLIDKLLQLKE